MFSLQNTEKKYTEKTCCCLGSQLEISIERLSSKDYKQQGTHLQFIILTQTVLTPKNLSISLKKLCMFIGLHSQTFGLSKISLCFKTIMFCNYYEKAKTFFNLQRPTTIQKNIYCKTPQLDKN